MRVRYLFVVGVMVVLSVVGVGCGSSKATTSPTSSSDTAQNTSAAESKAPFGQKDSKDGDKDPNSDDDEFFLDYGHAASATDEQKIAAVVRRYYTAAAAADGTKACAQISGIIAEKIPEEYAKSREFSGPTCAVVVSKIFKQRHAKMVADLAALKVTRVRIAGEKVYVFVYLGKVPEPYVNVHSEGSTWKMLSLFELKLP